MIHVAGQAGLGLQRLRPCRRARVARGACWRRALRTIALGLDPCRDGAGRGRCLGCDPRGARPLFPRRARSRRRSTTPKADFRSPRASPGIGRRPSASSAPMPAPRAISCSTATPRREGDVVRLPALAQSLEAIAAKGPRVFYEGPHRPRTWRRPWPRGAPSSTAEDFARHRGEVVAPIATNYRGLDVLELPPNTQGLTALVLLNILERFDLAAFDPDRRRPLPYRARGGAARLCRARCPYRRSRRHAGFAAGSARQELRGEACRPHRPCAARAVARRPVAGRRHRLSHGGRSRPHGGLADQHAVFHVRRRHLHGADRHHAHQPRRLFRARPRPSQRVRPGQAADAHDHPGARLSRGPVRAVVRGHGRALPAHGPRAAHHQHGRLRHGRAGGDRRAARVLRRGKHVVERGLPEAAVERPAGSAATTWCWRRRLGAARRRSASTGSGAC